MEGVDLGDLLLVRVGRGDRQAFEELYGELAGPVYGLVGRVLRDPAQSEEVTQDVLLEVWRTAARYDPRRGSALAWVLTVAHNQVRRCLDRLTDLQRQAVTLAYYDGHTYREVAHRLAAPLGTVKTRMRDGLLRLRSCLDGASV
ncbi:MULTISPECIES: sigma factor [unclassified Streptomyces]|uniref:sigma factor n=1 Tax=unclassified Streptomyces TaxID=2593676 RepID=UPI000DB9CFB7|nr:MULTISPECIES: sigma factor [unclassified Streptomyces]MYT72846.1 RNA polymerase subunit sigma [Streptomyces sp. SID8367]RAJ78823.1 RNA polymerase sigma-70 factor (ECF subfamily) [Streptomyces sp. PsTaAH-137]